MPDLETRLPELLRDLSTDAPALAADGSQALRRAKRRRILTAASGTVLAIALLTGSVVGFRALVPADRRSVAGPDDAPVAIWPETTMAEIDATQTGLTAEDRDVRLDPVRLAARFAEDVMGWNPAGTNVRLLDAPVGAPSVQALLQTDTMRRSLGPVSFHPTVLTLEQLGETGSSGVWSVVRAESAAVTLDAAPRTTSEDGTISGKLASLDTMGHLSRSVWIGAFDHFFGGNAADTYLNVPVADDGSFSATLPAAVLTSAKVLSVAEFGKDGSASWMIAYPLSSTDETFPSRSGRVVVGIMPPIDAPRAVIDTRDQIWDAVASVDFRAMRGLMDSNTFAYNFDDGSDPIPAWKGDPAVLDPILTLLQMQPAEPKHIEGFGTFFIWPYLVDSDMSNLSPSEIDDLHGLGFDDPAIEDMRRFGSYIGPRLAIDQNGLWRNYTTGGD
jgi:hypothetical protein